MAQVKLKKIISQKKILVSIVSDIISLSDTPITVWDMNGNVLIDHLGTRTNESLETHSIICESQELGLVKGGGSAALVAELLSYLADMEEEKKALGREVLNLYREVNLLYNLSKKLGTSLNLTVVAKLTLDEASRLITATIGSILLYDEQKDDYNCIASFGEQTSMNACLSLSDRIVNSVRLSGNAAIVNDVCSDNRGLKAGNLISSMIYVPLKAKNQTTGIILLASKTPVIYTAADLNLLNTVASQAAPVIENAFLHEKALEEAKKREEILRSQIQELRIELNLSKQEKKVTEITETDYFQRLRKQADSLRNIIDS
jgi:transcriptional regulator with GAF, ATPase, and Fis domain